MQKRRVDRNLGYWALAAAMAVWGLAHGAPAPDKSKPTTPPTNQPAAPVPKPGIPAPLPAKTPAAPMSIAAPAIMPIKAATEKPTTMPTVTAGGATWQCAASQCTTSAPASFATVETCHALALKVGRISSFGPSASPLNASQLGQCNEGIMTIATAIVASTPRIAPATGPVNIEINYIARPRAQAMPGMPGSSGAAPSGGGSPIALEVNYIATPKTAAAPIPSGAPTGAADTRPINIEINYIARPRAAETRR